MVKFAQVQEGAVVQLGRFNKSNSEHSHKVGLVVSKQTLKIGKSVWSAITVEVEPGQRLLVNINNIKSILN
jgi:hypothetical protein